MAAHGLEEERRRWRMKWTRYSIIESFEFSVVVHHPMWYIVFFFFFHFGGFFGGVKGGIADKGTKTVRRILLLQQPTFFSKSLSTVLFELEFECGRIR